MEARQRHKLEFVAHRRKFLLEIRNDSIFQFLFPVERRRAVVGQQFSREPCMDSLGKPSRFLQVRFRGFTPQKIGVGSVSKTASDGSVDSAPELEEAFHGPLPVQESVVPGVDVACHKPGAVGVGAGYDQGGNAGHVRGQACGYKFLHELSDGHHNFSAHVSAFLG